jgi:hypothetical protein
VTVSPSWATSPSPSMATVRSVSSASTGLSMVTVGSSPNAPVTSTASERSPDAVGVQSVAELLDEQAASDPVSASTTASDSPVRVNPVRKCRTLLFDACGRWVPGAGSSLQFYSLKLSEALSTVC